MLRLEGVLDRLPAPEGHQMRQLDALLVRLILSKCFSQYPFALTGKEVMNRVILMLMLIDHLLFFASYLFIPYFLGRITSLLVIILHQLITEI